MSESEQHTAEQSVKSTNQPKKLNSYTYWVDQKNKSKDLPLEQRPKKIQPQVSENKASNDGRSNWNTAGTWQHRKIDIKQVENDYTEALNNWIQQQDPTLKINSLSLSGECEIIFTRSKKALTYELTGKVQFQKKLPEVKQQKSQQTTEKNEVAKEKPIQKSQLVQQPKEQTELQKQPKLIQQVSSSSEKQGQKKDQQKKQISKKKPKTKKPKSQTMTFQVKQLTDHGDRQFSSKADSKQDQQWIKQRSENIMKLLESVLAKYK